jgi:hypothetical protein
MNQRFDLQKNLQSVKNKDYGLLFLKIYLKNEGFFFQQRNVHE